MFMLESHLNQWQNRIVTAVQEAAAQAGASVFLAGGALRDMLGGFPIRDLDFVVVDGDARAIARTAAEKGNGSLISEDSHRQIHESRFPGGVTAEISMARTEEYSRIGTRPKVSRSTIQEDLARRDFTVNAVALSLNRASLGLLVDPLNGLADLEHRELRTTSSMSFYDDPLRLLRLSRFRVRLGFSVPEKTRHQATNAMEAGVVRHIPARALGEELHRIARESNPLEILKALNQDGLLELFSPELTGAKLNPGGFHRLEKAVRAFPPGADLTGALWAPFMVVLTEKLTPQGRKQLIAATELSKGETASFQGLAARSARLSKVLQGDSMKKPSKLYGVIAAAGADQVIYLLYQSPGRLVHDRLRNYLQKYLPQAQEVSDEDVLAHIAETGAKPVKPGTPRFQAARSELIGARLDGRVRKRVPIVVEEPPPLPRGRRRAMSR